MKISKILFPLLLLIFSSSAFAIFTASFGYGYSQYNYSAMSSRNLEPVGGALRFSIGLVLGPYLELEGYYRKSDVKGDYAYQGVGTSIQSLGSAYGANAVIHFYNPFYLSLAAGQAKTNHKILKDLSQLQNQGIKDELRFLDNKSESELRAGLGIYLFDINLLQFFIQVERGWYQESNAVEDIAMVGLKAFIDPNMKPAKRKKL